MPWWWAHLSRCQVQYIQYIPNKTSPAMYRRNQSCHVISSRLQTPFCLAERGEANIRIQRLSITHLVLPFIVFGVLFIECVVSLSGFDINWNFYFCRTVFIFFFSKTNNKTWNIFDFCSYLTSAQLAAGKAVQHWYSCYHLSHTTQVVPIPADRWKNLNGLSCYLSHCYPTIFLGGVVVVSGFYDPRSKEWNSPIVFFSGCGLYR